MESNPKGIELITRLMKDEEPVVACKSKMTLQLAETIHEDTKWNALCNFKVDRAFVGIMPYMKYISTIFDLVQSWMIPPCVGILDSVEVRNDGI